MSIRDLYHHIRQPKLFSAIEIETTAVCNRRCPFCPNSLPGRKKGMMPDHDVYSILNQLSNERYEGRIAFHMYGEPLLDTRLVSFIAYAKLHCPQSFIKINTNGDYLTVRNLTAMIESGADLIYVSQYDGKLQPNVATVMRWICHDHPAWRHFMQVRIINSFDDNRAGSLPAIASIRHPLHLPCFRPSTTMVINWKGEHVLCCDDYFGTNIIGSIHSHSLRALWNSKKLSIIRRSLSAGNRQKIPLCSRCSYRQATADGDNTNEENFHLHGLFTSLFVPQETLWRYSTAIQCPRSIKKRYNAAKSPVHTKPRP